MGGTSGPIVPENRLADLCSPLLKPIENLEFLSFPSTWTPSEPHGFFKGPFNHLENICCLPKACHRKLVGLFQRDLRGSPILILLY